MKRMRHIFRGLLIRFYPRRNNKVAADHFGNSLALRVHEHHDSFSIIRNHSIKIDQLSDAFGNTICDSTDHHATITMTYQDNVIQVLKKNGIDDILYVSA